MGDPKDQRLLRARVHMDRIEEDLKLAAAKYALDIVPTRQLRAIAIDLQKLWPLAGMEGGVPVLEGDAEEKDSRGFRNGCWTARTGVEDLRALWGGGREDLARRVLPRVFHVVRWLWRCCEGLKAANEAAATEARTEAAA